MGHARSISKAFFSMSKVPKKEARTIDCLFDRHDANLSLFTIHTPIKEMAQFHSNPSDIRLDLSYFFRQYQYGASHEK